MSQIIGKAVSKQKFSYTNYEGVLATTVQIKDGEELDVIQTSDGNRILYLDTHTNIRYIPKEHEDSFEISLH
ncbi:hypothetical protein Curi_c26600 [Gottschalkia acidurici 9a]|uniref:Uncharacterized protein n=1 Tax=Gottschalkia acidurici (strain ATCC 7906 / DSM 604 / BCRC 14475 / CIP 104303 / KCTC 5404 / NCIMB 10678 / 9a) TaxID=1128398 RepID=K0B403_GOTA9|nr:hypothetical protein [Gottschalkia acidurici]AFS79655.1 hypothetical protein Curi_c26600 [Gottschalkia acidurici 9a]